MTDLQQSISDEYIPNQPIGSPFYMPPGRLDGTSSSNDYMFGSALLRNNPEVLRYHPPDWGPLHRAHTNAMIKTEYDDRIMHGNQWLLEPDNQVSGKKLSAHYTLRGQLLIY